MDEWGPGNGWDKVEVVLFTIMVVSSLAVSGVIVWFLVTLARKLG